MFTYCLNNPTNMKDVTGRVPVNIITGVETEEDEDTPNTYHTTLVYLIADSDNPYSFYASNPQSVTYTYTITNGRIQMYSSTNEVLFLFDAGICCSLADAMIRQAKTINSESMAGRTTSGVAFELLVHVTAYKFGFMTKRADPVDIGASIEGSYGYDDNAAFFENPLFRMDILFDILNN